MNKTYKVIYNRTRCMYQVVSELAKGRTKSETPEMLKTVFSKHGSLARGIVMAVLSMSLAMPVGVAVQAEEGSGNTGSGDTTYISDTNTEVKNIQALDKQVVKNAQDIANNKTSIDTNTTNIGTNQSNIEGNKTAIGENKTAIEKNIISIAKNTSTIAANKTAIDKNTASIATNTNNIAANTTAISNETTARTKAISDLETKLTTGDNSLASKANVNASNIGKNITTGATDDEKKKKQEENATLWGKALGLGAIENGDSMLISGGTLYSELRPSDGTYVKNAKTTADNLLALDKNLKNVIDAIGLDADDTTTSYTSKLNKYFKVNPEVTTSADGKTYAADAAANGTNSVAIGPSAQAGDKSTDATTSTTTITGGKSSTAIGDSAKANGDQSVALGYGSEVLNASGSTTAVSGSTAIGSGAKVEGGSDSTALGSGATVDTASNAMALGKSATINKTAASGVAIGNGAVTGSADKTITVNNLSYAVKAAGGENSVAIGTDASSAGNTSLALGKGATVENDSDGNYQAVVKSNDIAIGTDAKTSASDSSTAIGKGASVAQSTDALAIGSSAAVGASSTNAMALGKSATVSGGATDSIAMGTSAKTISADTIAIGQNTSAEGANSVVIGKSAKTTSDGGNAIGFGSAASGSSTAIGQSATANNYNALAIGNNATANADKSISLGYNAGVGTSEGKGETQNAGSLIAIGTSAGNNVSGMQNVAIGESAGSHVKSSYNIAIGTQAGYGINYASDNKSQNGYNVSIGYKANYQEQSADIMYSTALGNEANASNYAVAIGDGAKASGNNSLALGYSDQASDAESMALGHNASAADGNVAIGNGSSAPAVSSLGTVKDGYVYQSTTSTDSSGAATTTLTELKSAFTYKPLASDSHYISVGTTDLTRRISNVADGVFASDAATVGQLNSLNELLQSTNTEVGLTKDYFEQKFTDLNTTIDASKTHYFSISESSDNLSANKDNTGATSNKADAMAIGPNANATNVKSLAVGNNVYATGLRSIAIGTAPNPTKDAAGTTTTHNTSAEGENSIALGTSTTAQADNSVAIGTRAQAYTTDTDSGKTGARSVAIGNLATTAGNQSVALGYDATVKYNYGTAIGAETLASGNDAVAIGKGSKAYSTDSTAIGQGNSITGNNVYGLGSSNEVSGKWGAVTQSGISGYQNTITSVSDQDTTNALKGIYMTGNANDLNQQNKYNVMEDITVQGTNNKIYGGSNISAGHPNTLSQIAIVGSGNNVHGKSDDDGRTNNIENVTILGYNNKVDANTDTTVDFSNTQILGNNVTATLGNSVYLGNKAAYVQPTSPASDAITAARTAADTAAEASNEYKAAATDEAKVQIKAEYEAKYLYKLRVQAMEGKGTTAGMNSYDTDETYGNGTSYTYAGSNPTGVITVGSVGSERRIQNVAAGLVSATSTDAVNGSQLYALTRQLRFGGDNSSFGTTTADDKNVVARGSNETIAITGGSDAVTSSTTDGNTTYTVDTTKLTDNNIAVVADTDNEALHVQLASNLKDLNTAQLGSGSGDSYKETIKLDGTGANGGQMTLAGADGTVKTTVDTTGLTVANGPKFTSSGIDAASQQINHVTAGTSDTDAVNYGQLKNARTLLTQGTNTRLADSVSGDQHTYTVNVDNLAVKVNSSQKSVHLKDGLVFGNGTNTTATMSDDGTITYNISDATIKTRAKDAINLTAGSNVTVDTATSADGTTKTFTVKATHNKLTSATAATGDQDNVTLTLKDADGNEVTTTGLKNTYSTGGSVTYAASGEGTATVTRNDGNSYTITGLKDTKVSSGTATYVGTQGDASGTATLKMNDGTTATISGLKDDYITSAAVGTENNHVTMTRLGGGTVDLNLNPILEKYSLSDYRLVGNGDTQDQAYQVSADGTVTLNVVDAKDAANKKTIQITGLASQSGVNAGRTTVTSSNSSVTVSDSAANGDTHTYDIKVDYSKIPGHVSLSYTGDTGSGSNTMNNSVKFAGTTNQVTTTAKDGQVTFALASDIKGINSVTTGNTTLNTNGVSNGKMSLTGTGMTITDTDASKQISVTTNGVSMGSQRIQNVANAEVDTDAATLGQVKNARTVVAGGSNVAGVDSSEDKTTHQMTYTVNVDNLSVKANKEAAKSVTLKNGLTFNNGTNTTASVGDNGEVKYDLNSTLTGLTSVTAGNSTLDTNGLTIKDGAATKVEITSGNVTMGGNVIHNVGDGIDPTDAVNKGQLDALQTQVSGGWNLAGKNSDGNDVTAKIGAGKTVTYDNGNYTKSVVTKDDSTGNATVKVDVTTGTFGSGTGDKAGTVTSTAKGLATTQDVANAINSAAINVVADNTPDNKTSVKAGDTIQFAKDDNLTLTQDGTKFTYGLNKEISISKVTTSDTTNGSTVQDAKGITTTDAAGNTYIQDGKGITLTPSDKTKSPVKLTNTGLNNGGNKITGVGKGTDDADAVNMAQLKEVNDKVGSGWQIAGNDGQKVADIGAGKKVSFKTDSQYLTADTKTAGTDAANVTYGLKTKTLTAADGKVSAVDTAEDGLATAKNVAETINQTYWTAASGKSGSGSQTDETANPVDKQISTGDTVTFNAGNNLSLVQNGASFTYGLQANLTGMNTITFTPKNDAEGHPVSLVIGKQKDGVSTNEGYYITGLDNTSWNQSNYVKNRAATEAQLADAIKQVTLASQSGGFKLSDDNNKEVSQVLGQAIGVVGDSNITTTAETTTTDTNGHIKVSLNKTLNLTDQGSVTIGSSQVSDGSIVLNNTDATKKITLNSKEGTASIGGVTVWHGKDCQRTFQYRMECENSGR